MLSSRAPRPAPFLDAAPNFTSTSESPRAFLERCLERLALWEPDIRAFVCLDLDAARAAADKSTLRWRSGRPLSAIDGMPVGVKDIIETANMPTGQGSPLFTGYETRRDAASVVALRAVGAVVVGKTVTTEFAATGPRETRNPWDLSRTPGGSSSGSAAAVASGLVTAALAAISHTTLPPNGGLAKLFFGFFRTNLRVASGRRGILIQNHMLPMQRGKDFQWALGWGAAPGDARAASGGRGARLARGNETRSGQFPVIRRAIFL